MYTTDINKRALKEESLSVDEIDLLKAKIQLDPWSLESYKRGIYISSALKDKESLDYFRKTCIKYCVVDDIFWLSYIDDKQDATEKELIGLYEAAVSNEPSVEIWLSYLRYVCKKTSFSSDYSWLRALFERALDSFGLHALDGPLLWSEYRQFEHILLDKVPKSECKAQLERIRKLFYRQLALPLAGLPDLLDEYLAWEGELPLEYRKPTDKGENAHKIGFDAWERRKFFELRIQSEFDEMVNPGNMNALWNDYIEFELKGGDKDRINIVYHRALDDLGYERDDLWINYANHASKESHSKALWICERASRHMPRCVNVWINSLLVLAVTNPSVEDLMELFNKAVSAVTEANGLVSLHITAADCLRRTHPGSVDTFRSILSRGEKLLSSKNDSASESKGIYRLLSYWGRHELRLLAKGGSAFEYLKVVQKLLNHYRKDPLCWMCLIDGVKSLDASGGCTGEVVEVIFKGLNEVIQNTDVNQLSPKTGNGLVIWLYETALSNVSTSELAEDYIDYVQTSGVVEDIKKAHMTVAAQISNAGARCSGTTLSLNNIILRRDRRRKKSESFSETSSDSGSLSSRLLKGTLGLRQDQPYLSIRSPKLTLRDLEIATRATWDGCESADPSLAPAVPPNIPMPPPASPVISKVASSCASTSGVFSTPECSPDLKKLKDDGNTATQKIHPLLLPNSVASETITPDDQDDIDTKSTTKSDLPQDKAQYFTKEPGKGHHLLLNEEEAVLSWLRKEEELNTLWVSNLGPMVTESDVYLLFSTFSGLRDVRMLKNRGCCYVEFETVEDAKNALEKAANRRIAGSTFKCELSKPTKPLFEDKVVFVRKITPKFTLDQDKLLEDLTAFFKQMGFVPRDVRFVAIDPPVDDVGKPQINDYCYVEFGDKDSARKIIQKLMNEAGWPLSCDYGGLRFEVSPSIPIIRRAQRIFRKPKETPSKRGKYYKQRSLAKTVYVTNLNYDTTQDKLAEFFSKNCGPVDAVLICADRMGKSRGYGYVAFTEERHAMDALLLSSSRLDDREIFVSKSTKPFPLNTEPSVVKRPAECMQPPNIVKSYVKVKKKINLT